MLFETSTKTGGNFENKPHIKKGYYQGTLKEVKPIEKEGKFGKRIVLIWEVEGVELAQVLNSEYKQEDGTYRTAFTPNSRATKTFQALGWELKEGEPLNVDEFIGKKAELNVDDYDTEDNEGKPYKASGIKDVSKLETEEGKTSSPTYKENLVPVNDDAKDRYDSIKVAYETKAISKQGFDMAVESMKAAGDLK